MVGDPESLEFVWHRGITLGNSLNKFLTEKNLVGQETFPNVVWHRGITLVGGNTVPNKFLWIRGTVWVPGITLGC